MEIQFLWPLTVIEPLDFDISLLIHHVDDTLLAVPEDKVKIVLKKINEFNDKLQFTIEREIKKNLPFLDIKVIRTNRSWQTNWYRKPTSSGIVLNFYLQILLLPTHQ